MSWHRLTSKYPGTCIICNQQFNIGTAIDWDDQTRKTRHDTCRHIRSPLRNISKTNNTDSPFLVLDSTRKLENSIMSSIEAKIGSPFPVLDSTRKHETDFLKIFSHAKDFEYRKREREFLRDSYN